ncbi:hypothetical protein [Neochlamydia sp. S13]|jgi:hypothetical protein|nr:hypothetical protein [Neochlamydia sp. S13]
MAIRVFWIKSEIIHSSWEEAVEGSLFFFTESQIFYLNPMTTFSKHEY